MKKIFFTLLVFLVVVLCLPHPSAAETPSPTPQPDELLAQALAAKQAHYPAWIGDEEQYHPQNPDLPKVPPADLSAPSDVEEWYQVAYQMWENSNWEIYTYQNLYNAYTSVRLTYNTVSDFVPRLNPGATSIVFTSLRDGNYELYTMNRDGSGVTRLTGNEAVDSQGTWRADGSQIAFVSDRDGNAEIYKMNADGSGLTRLTFDETTDVSPTWAPDGQRLAWLRVVGYSASAWVMNADGTDAHQITDYWIYGQHLNWSPDGEWLAMDGDFTGDGWNEAVRFRPDGTGFQQISENSSNYKDLWVSSWVPDNQRMLLTYVYYQLYGGELYIVSSGQQLILIGGQGDAPQQTMSDFSMNFSVQSLDITAPSSLVLPLPTYSRVTQFPVFWEGTDSGLSGFRDLSVQTRLGLSGSWTDWQAYVQPGGVPYQTGVLPGEPGETLYFRSQARDFAGNVQSWPAGNGNTSTTLFTTFLKGIITDARGIPLGKSSVTVSPTPVRLAAPDLNGKFSAWLSSFTTQALSFSHPGYGDWGPLTVEAPADQVANVYLFTNDGVAFEPQQGSSTPSGLGSPWLTLGSDCYPCLTTGEYIDPELNLLLPILLPGENGRVHLITAGLTYHEWVPESGWSTTYQIPGNAWSQYGNYVDAKLDQAANLHVVWENNETIYYVQRSANGQWSTPLLLGENIFAPQIGVDSQGRVYLFFTDRSEWVDRIYYEIREPNGAWGNKNLFMEGKNSVQAQIIIDHNDVVHVFTGGENIQHIWFLPNGSLHQEFVTFGYKNMQVALDDNNNLHFLWLLDNLGRLGYMRRSPSGSWSQPEISEFSLFNFRLALDHQGNLHLVGYNASENQFEYITRYWEGGWEISPLTDGSSATEYNVAALAFDSNNALHVAWPANIFLNGYNTQTLKHAHTAYATEAESLSFSYPYTLPTTLHKPTLAYLYQLQGAADWANSGYTVSVTEGTTTTQVISSTMPAENQTLGWVDMSAWAGKTISVTFTVHQAANEPSLRLRLYEITLGSWFTPVPLAVDLPQLPLPNNPTQITITGENFLEGATVRLGDQLLENVQWLDEHTLQATIPGNLLPGRYDLWVINPGGQTAVLPGAVIAGHEVFLPLLFR